VRPSFRPPGQPGVQPKFEAVTMSGKGKDGKVEKNFMVDFLMGGVS
jgi:hypothetical protein